VPPLAGGDVQPGDGAVPRRQREHQVQVQVGEVRERQPLEAEAVVAGPPQQLLALGLKRPAAALGALQTRLHPLQLGGHRGERALLALAHASQPAELVLDGEALLATPPGGHLRQWFRADEVRGSRPQREGDAASLRQPAEVRHSLGGVAAPLCPDEEREAAQLPARAGAANLGPRQREAARAQRRHLDKPARTASRGRVPPEAKRDPAAPRARRDADAREGPLGGAGRR